MIGTTGWPALRERGRPAARVADGSAVLREGGSRISTGVSSAAQWLTDPLVEPAGRGEGTGAEGNRRAAAKARGPRVPQSPW
jgi:hypothetical protein